MDTNYKDKNTIKSAYKIFHLLEVLIEYENLSLSELSKITGFTKGTTQRIVNTLRDLKYINQDNQSLKYYPSLKIYQLGHSIIDNFPIKKIAKPHLVELYREVNETVNLAVLNDNGVIYLDKLVSTSPLRVELEIGTQFPIYCSALGKAMVAFNYKNYSFNNEYKRYTKNTISSDRELNKELENIRKQGYAIDNQEYIDGLICIATPILDDTNTSIAAISISIPVIRYDEKNMQYYINLLTNTANKIKVDLFI